MADSQRNQWVTPAEAARLLGVHRSSITRAIADGRLRAHKCADGRMRLDTETLRHRWTNTQDPMRALQSKLRRADQRQRWLTAEADRLVQQSFIADWDSPNHQQIDAIAAQSPEAHQLLSALYDAVYRLAEVCLDAGLNAAGQPSA